MAVTMCPGQNTAFWKPGDIFDIICPACGEKVEFFKDDARRRCQGCGYVFSNPKLNEGCAQWCEFAEKCLGLNPGIAGPAPVGDNVPSNPGMARPAPVGAELDAPPILAGEEPLAK